MKRFLLPLAAILLISGCSKSKPQNHLNGQALLKQKCSHCHNLDMPAKTSEHEKAPPIMAVVFHVKDFMKVNDPSTKKDRFISFVQDYVIHPDASKSYCDKKSLQSYGVMPSQKGKVTKEQLGAIASYMYDHYDPNVFMKLMLNQARLNRMPVYKRILEQKNCLSCHGIDKDKIAPSFKSIADRYKKKGQKTMMQSIKNGSRGKWKRFHLIMPPFKDLNSTQLQAITSWILTLK